MKLKGKVAIITGAGKGIGYDTAVLFVKEGAKVVATSRSKEDLDALSKEIGQEHLMLPFDLSDSSACSEILKKTLEKFGKIDILVNNAGIFLMNEDTYEEGKELTFNRENINKLLNVNQLAPWFLAMEVIAQVKENLSIINVASVNGVFGKGVADIYDMTKAAEISMTKNLARRYARNNIRVNCVNPSSTLTNMRNRAFARYDPNTPRDKADKDEAKTIPLGRLGEARDIANAILFIASDDANYITGQDINVDGGYLLNPVLF